MKYTISFPAMMAILFLLPGCTRLVDWVKCSFYQGGNVCYDASIPNQYIRSVTVYDEFDTCGRFDILWLSNQVRIAYAQVYNIKRGMIDDNNSLVRCQLAENDYFITFYVIVPPTYILDDRASEWSLFLQIDGHRIVPIEIKEFDIEPEYKAFLGKHFNRFRVAYRVKFPAKDNEGVLFLDESIEAITLHARSFSKNLLFVWHVVRD